MCCSTTSNPNSANFIVHNYCSGSSFIAATTYCYSIDYYSIAAYSYACSVTVRVSACLAYFTDSCFITYFVACYSVDFESTTSSAVDTDYSYFSSFAYFTAMAASTIAIAVDIRVATVAFENINSTVAITAIACFDSYSVAYCSHCYSYCYY